MLEMRGIRKAFPGVQALGGVDLRLAVGEVLALVGENGAGKSTLMKILAGAEGPDAGTILLDGAPVEFRSPHAARQAGIAVIHQEFNLVPGLSARENIFLGQEATRLGFVRRLAERRQAQDLVESLGGRFDVDQAVRRLSTAQQQLVEIARALVQRARVLVLDEPTAALTERETERLFDLVRDLQRQGLGLIHISHRLEEVFRIADRIQVLRDGATVGERPVAGTERAELIRLMVGRELKDEFPPRIAAPRGNLLLEATGLRRGQAVRGVDLAVRAGEILGLAGLVGAGRTETLRLLFGADRREAGSMRLHGQDLRIDSPRDAIAAGIGLLPEDRKTQGLVLGLGVRDNFALPNLGELSRCGFVRRGKERTAFDAYAERLRLKSAGPRQPVRQLSGGNQQKIVLAKWLARRCEVLLFDEPTRGVDVGARHEIYLLLRDLAAQGKAVVLASSELPELLGLCDRLLVLREGRVVGEVVPGGAGDQERVLALAMGQAPAAT